MKQPSVKPVLCKFYVYEWFIVDSLKVFYVGKGQGKRRFHIKNRNTLFQAVYKKYNCAVRLVKSSLTEQEAYEFEMDRIAELKTIGQAYCNFSKGGEGNSLFGEDNPCYGKFGEDHPAFGTTLTKEERMKISERMSGKNNPFFNKSGSSHPTSKSILVNDVKFGSVKEVCEWAKQFPKPNSRSKVLECLYNGLQFHGFSIKYNKGDIVNNGISCG